MIVAITVQHVFPIMLNRCWLDQLFPKMPQSNRDATT